ncbi:MAG: DUF177 domain-containing protein [Bacteroidetes bacterium]|nr:DUF177 domain-containing protein [Bacteroidota bacterium]MBL6944842.1 DUF177 domain-containing protein [Bacteroidales bacterium]
MVEYIIPIKGLCDGDHQYTYKIDDEFFRSFEHFDIEKGLLNLIIDLTKESTLMDFRFQFKGNVELQCDRCLDKFNMNIENSFRLIVKYGEIYEEVSDEIITIPSSQNNIELRQLIYEYINLMVPIKKVHPDDDFGKTTCNKEMIIQLNKYSEQKSDPRWDALKNIKLE